MRCSRRFVHTAAQHTRALRQSAAKREIPAQTAFRCLISHLFLLAAVGSVLAAATLRAETPILTLAMVRPHDLHARPLENTTGQFALNTSRAALPAFQLPSTAINPASPAAPERYHFPASLLERHNDSEGTGSLVLGRKNLRELGRSKMWASLETGYGQLFDDRPPTIYGRNGAAWEEPSCGYLKLSFSF